MDRLMAATARRKALWRSRAAISSTTISSTRSTTVTVKTIRPTAVMITPASRVLSDRVAMIVHVLRRSDGEALHHRPYRRLPSEEGRVSVRQFTVDRSGKRQGRSPWKCLSAALCAEEESVVLRSGEDRKSVVWERV